MKKRGQAGLEYVAVVGFVLMILIPLFIVFQTNSQTTSNQLCSSHMLEVGHEIVRAAETVYYLGEPSKMTLNPYFPQDIARASVGPNELVFTVMRNGVEDDIVVYSPINITGSIDTAQGKKNIVIEAKGGYVWISG